MENEIKRILEDIMPMVDWDSDFVFSELDSLQIVHILITLADKYKIELSALDATPKNLKNLTSITNMVENKLKEKQM